MPSVKSGTTSKLIIDDSGGKIYFRVNNTQAASFVYGCTWSGTVNGKSVSGKFDLVGAKTVTVGSWTVSTNQTVKFSIGRSGSSGIGGPTSMSYKVNRTPPPTAPKAPTAKTPTNVKQTTLTFAFSSNGNGGSDVTEWQYGYGTSNSSPQHTGKTSGTTNLTGLAPDTLYYFWGRGKNKVGWGPWSNRVSARTVSGAYVKVNGSWKPAVPYIKVSGSWKVAQPWLKSSSFKETHN